MLTECFVTDEQVARTLVTRQIPSYGETTILQLAVENDNEEFRREFVSHQACQKRLNNIWWGKMDEQQYELRVTLIKYYIIVL